MIVQVAVDETILTQPWRTRLAELGGGLKVGLAWKTPATDTLRDWGPVLAVPGAHFVSLQDGATESELRDALNMFGVMVHGYPEADPAADLDGFSALVAALDLVIAVDDAVTQLAGEVGVTCWKLPGSGEVAAWQPNTRLFCPSQSGDWRSLMSEVARELESTIGNNSEQDR
jgi:hypothetical protein